MDFLRDFLDGMTRAPFHGIARMLELQPGRLLPGLSLLAAIITVAELVRIALGNVLTHSRVAHVTVCFLTFAFQALLIAGVLVFADRAHPGRGWINLGFALALYLLWFVVGQATKLVRRDSEGADVGFMAVGALITFPTGVIAAALT